MKEEMAILSPFEGFTELVQIVCQEIGEKIRVVEAYGNESLEIAEKLQNEGCKVILARGSTASFLKLKDEILVPIVNLNITAFDLLQSFYNISNRKNKKIGYIGYWEEEELYDFSTFERILKVKIVPLSFHSEEDVEHQVRRAVENKVETVLTTGICIAKLCKDFGLPSTVVYPSKNSVIQGIQQARQILAARKRDHEHSQRLWTVINAAFDGVLVTNAAGKVTMINPAAEQILDSPVAEILGKPLSLLETQFNVSGKKAENEVIKLGERYLVLKRIPLQTNEGSRETLLTFRDVSEIQKLEQLIRKETWEKGLRAKFTFNDIIGKSSAIQSVINQAKHYAQSHSTVLILGESGTGKELIAQSIHNASARRNKPFVAVNCAALPETLLDSELFGYERGAFTGAEKGGKPGLFELAHRGTIFLDEISDLSFPLQAKLLRVLQEKEVRRISGEKVIPVDIRVIAATNRDLAQEVCKGNFREDLYYRLNVLTLKLPPLRERQEDIKELANYFLQKHARANGKQIPPLSPYFISRLTKYHWPGNIRELENLIEKYVLLFDEGQKGENILLSLLMENFSSYTLPPVEVSPDDSDSVALQVRLGTLEEIEFQVLTQLIKKYKMEKSKVASILGISRTTLWKKLKNSGDTVL